MSRIRDTRNRLLLLLVLFILGAGNALAQFSSGIEGTVHDTGGAVVPGAKVTITDTRLNVTKTIATSDAGYFRFDSIAASTYNLEIVVNGFETYHESLTLQVGELRTLTPELKPGSVSTEVTVEATQAALNLAAAATGSVVTEETVSVTPLGGQNVYGLASLTPGITGSATNSTDNYTNEYAININAAGLRQEENGYQIDGAYTDTPSRAGGTSISPNPEIVASIDILTNNFDAGKGRNGGATVNVFTKSGANNFHGTGDYYFLNNNLVTRTEFQSSVPAFRRQEMGVTAGGPIVKNKLFFYGAIDVLRSSNVSAGAYTVETPDLVNWVKTNLPDNVATQVLTTAAPLSSPTSNIITASQVTGSYFAPPANIPATLPVLGTANISFSVPKNGYQWSVRGDDYVGQKDRVYAEFMRTYDTAISALARSPLNYNQSNSSDFANADWTHTFSPRLLNEVGANMIRPYGADLPTTNDAIPYINVTGMTGFANWGPGNFTQTTIGWRDVLTAVVKSHTLKFGFQEDNIREADSQSGAFDRPTYNFNSILDFIQDEATSESGTPVSLLTHAEAPYDRRYRALVTGAFVQDDWKVTPRLTVNAGLRFDSMQNFFSIYSPTLTNFRFGDGSTYNDQIASGVAGLQNTTHVLNHTVYLFTPRVGFSYDLFGNGRTALRGGFGMFADQPPYIHVTDITAGNLPNYYTPSISVQSGQTPGFQLCSAPSGFTENCPVVDTSNVTLNSSGGITGQRASLGGYSPNYKLTQIEEWSISVQHQFTNTLVAELNYSASSAHHLPVFNQDINRFAGDLVVNKGTLTRLNANFGDINYATSDGNSNGNVGSLVVAKQLAHGYSLRGIYTYGKALDTFSNSGSLDTGAITTSTSVIRNGNLKSQYGRADYDIRQQLSIDGTWTLPKHFSNGIVQNVLGGWQLGGLWLFHTGLPFTVYNGAGFVPVYDTSGNVVGNTGGDYNADGSNYDVPNAPSFGPHLGGQSRKKFITGLFNVSDFPTPALGTEGSLGRNTYDQPGYNNLDFTVAKLFTTKWFGGEKLHLEGKAEAFDLFNRVNLTGVNSDLSSGSLFGKSTTELQRLTGGRAVQIHLRGSF